MPVCWWLLVWPLCKRERIVLQATLFSVDQIRRTINKNFIIIIIVIIISRSSSSSFFYIKIIKIIISRSTSSNIIILFSP